MVVSASPFALCKSSFLPSSVSTKVHFVNFLAPSSPDFEASTRFEFGSSNKLQTVSTLLLIWSRFSCIVRASFTRLSGPVSSMNVIESFLHCRHSTNSTSFDFGVSLSSVEKFFRNSRRWGILLFTVFTIFVMESITILQCSMLCLQRFASRCRRFRRSIVESNIVLSSSRLRRSYCPPLRNSWSRKFVSRGSDEDSLIGRCLRWLAPSRLRNVRSMDTMDIFFIPFVSFLLKV